MFKYIEKLSNNMFSAEVLLAPEMVIFNDMAFPVKPKNDNCIVKNMVIKFRQGRPANEIVILGCWIVGAYHPQAQADQKMYDYLLSIDYIQELNGEGSAPFVGKICHPLGRFLRNDSEEVVLKKSKLGRLKVWNFDSGYLFNLGLLKPKLQDGMTYCRRNSACKDCGNLFLRMKILAARLAWGYTRWISKHELIYIIHSEEFNELVRKRFKIMSFIIDLVTWPVNFILSRGEKFLFDIKQLRPSN